MSVSPRSSKIGCGYTTPMPFISPALNMRPSPPAGMRIPPTCKYAAQMQAVFVTHNIPHFLWLHRWWKTLQAWDLLPTPHGGILGVPPSVPLDQLGTELFTFLTQHPPPVLENNLYLYRQGQWGRELW